MKHRPETRWRLAAATKHARRATADLMNRYFDYAKEIGCTVERVEDGGRTITKENPEQAVLLTAWWKTFAC